MPVEVPSVTAGTKMPAKEEAQDPVYLRIRDLVYQTCGIYHSEEKLYLLVGACKRRMATTGGRAGNAREYLDLLTNLAFREAETRGLLNEITIGETCLFRSQAQINALQNAILPEITKERAKIGLKRLKVWSAGCSTGEEPYTLAMFLLEMKENLLRDWNFDIQATDLNDRSIDVARAGIYGDYALRNTPELYKRKYFTCEENGKLKVRDDVKSRITFTRMNLNEDSRMVFMKGMDLVFCCNVLIYFEVADSALGNVVQALTRALTLGTQGANGTLSAENRQAIAGEVQGLLNQTVSLANTTYQGAYLFGGTAVNAQPFTLDPATNTVAYHGNSASTSVDLSRGNSITANLPGDKIFLNPGGSVMGALQDLYTSLTTGTNIPAAVTEVNGALSQVSLQRVFYGNALNQINLSEAFLGQEKVNLSQQENGLAGADMAEVATNFAQAQVANQSTLTATARVLSLPTLLDFLE
jgi:chemotaxis protein methyltransferase CheR